MTDDQTSRPRTKDMDKLSVAREAAAATVTPGADRLAADYRAGKHDDWHAVRAALAALAQPAPDGERWNSIATCPRDGKQMAVQDRKGKLHIIYANPELDRSNLVCWSRPAQGGL